MNSTNGVRRNHHSLLILFLLSFQLASCLSVGGILSLANAETDSHVLFPTGAKIDSETKEQWLSVGLGVRTSFSSQQNGSANGHNYSNAFGIQNARLYVNGAFNRYLKFEFNTDCFNCPSGQTGAGGGSGFFGGNSTIGVLDLIGKVEYNQYVNLWFGRLLVPGERGELNGPFFHATYDGFRTPFNSADFSGNIGNGGAGLYGRDDGAVFWGEFNTSAIKQIQYSLGAFRGLRSNGSGCVAGPCGPNQANNLLYAGRLTFNFLNPEKNPGYYTAGTYYGKAGDILALAGGFNFQAKGAGSFQHPSDLTIFTSDLLFEKVLPNAGVFTFNAEFKRYWADYASAAFTDPNPTVNNFAMFRGTSVTAYALYLLPDQIGWGKLQPYGRYTYIDPQGSLVRKEYELGLNYVIKGFNSRVSAFWQYGDINTKSLTNYASSATGEMVHRFVMAYQFQY